MSTTKRTKINQLLAATPGGIVLLSSWLKHQGYSAHLIKRYGNTGWLESIGVGAYIRAGDNVDCLGALYSLQTQSGLNVHVGGRSAFSMLAKSHYLELDMKNLILFGSRQNRLPTWFIRHHWPIRIEFYSSDFLPPEMGLVDVQVKEFKVKVSGEIRALMECLQLVPNNQDITECYELMENMNNVPPKTVQELLEHCTSIKVKRLFLYLSEKIGHVWFNYLDLSKIDLGTGKRSIIKGGILDKKYQITVPKLWTSQANTRFISPK